MPAFLRSAAEKMLIIAIPSAIQQSFISVGNILVQRVINGFGTACMGGYTAAIKLNNMFVTSVTALGNGMSNYTSQNLGAGKNERVRHGCRSGVTIGMTMGAISRLCSMSLRNRWFMRLSATATWKRSMSAWTSCILSRRSICSCRLS